MAVIRDHRLRSDGSVRAGLLSVEARWAEFASWTAENLGLEDAASYWLGHSLELAHEADDTVMESYALMRQAQRAVERRHVREARALADAAWAVTGASDRDRALCAVRQAQGYALAGDSRACQAAIQLAYELVAQADEVDADDDPRTIGHHCGQAYIQAHEAHCQLLLRQPRKASELLQRVLASWPSEYRQDEQLARAWLALSYAADGHWADAAVEGTRALSLATTGGSARVRRSLRALDRQFATNTGLPPEVSAFRSAFAFTARRM
ncbi:hypothetical protein ACFU99_03465 [Streptomyces sp. NPDC057654]|uniref:hypothetical protein n=1 Tax=Streptomyces sp. NPDC057654 TaxID=3346196 RepID=UPI0036A714CD